MQSEYWTLVDQNGMGLYLVDSEAEALEWCESDYGGANVIRPMRVYMAHDLAAAQRDAARYRWLRGDTCADHSVRWTQWEVRSWRAPRWTDDLRREGLDAAIDAAMQEGKE